MQTTAPHYLLLTETEDKITRQCRAGRWRFVLESMNADDDRVEVSECETDIFGERLQLLAVVRGIEALEQPSKLTLITSSAYVGKRIRKGFDSWIEKDWRWESFGVLKPVKDVDLWKRIHAATQIHSIECRLWQFGERHRTNEDHSAETENWNRIDEAHPQELNSPVRKPFGPVEFEDAPTTRVRPAAVADFAPHDHDEPRFAPTRTGWTRVTEIDPDTNRALLFPQAFGETVY